ncbi:hypothetical protein Hamer_G013298, partial [Homarus americanus]
CTAFSQRTQGYNDTCEENEASPVLPVDTVYPRSTQHTSTQETHPPILDPLQVPIGPRYDVETTPAPAAAPSGVEFTARSGGYGGGCEYGVDGVDGRRQMMDV